MSTTHDQPPERLRLSRRKGYRLPLGAKSVARPSHWGNPFIVWRNQEWYADTYDAAHRRMGDPVRCADNLTARKIATEAFDAALAAGWHRVPTHDEILELRGFSLACWCPLPAPGGIDWCHAAVLLRVGNQ